MSTRCYLAVSGQALRDDVSSSAGAGSAASAVFASTILPGTSYSLWTLIAAYFSLPLLLTALSRTLSNGAYNHIHVQLPSPGHIKTVPSVHQIIVVVALVESLGWVIFVEACSVCLDRDGRFFVSVPSICGCEVTTPS